MTTSVAGGVAGQGTPIQLVGLQVNPGGRNLTATASATGAMPNQSQQTATIINTTQKLPVQRLSCPQLVRTLTSGAGSGGTTLKLTQSGGLQVQGTSATTGGIFGESSLFITTHLKSNGSSFSVNQTPGLNSILMTPLQTLQKQKQQQAILGMVSSQQQQQPQHQHQQQFQQVAALQQSQQQSTGPQATTIVAKATTKHGK